MGTWRTLMHGNVAAWLLQGHCQEGLPARLLMPLGNSDLFDERPLAELFASVERRGVFRVGRTAAGEPVAYTTSLFGAPKVAMYLEVARRAGVEVVIAAGYVGSFVKDVPIGSLFVPTAAIPDDGTSRAYGLDRGPAPADPALTQAIFDAAGARNVPCSAGTVASIDAIMLEDDAMLEGYRRQGASAIDMETGCLFALARHLGMRAAAVHIVSDNAADREIDDEGRHMLSLRTQLEVALAALGRLE